MPAPDDPRTIRRDLRPVTALHLSLAEAADLGLDAAELRRLAAMSPDRFRQRNAMARNAGLDPARLEADFALDLATALLCADCAAAGACRRGVAEGLPPEEAGFCANLGTFQMLAKGT